MKSVTYVPEHLLPMSTVYTEGNFSSPPFPVRLQPARLDGIAGQDVGLAGMPAGLESDMPSAISATLLERSNGVPTEH